MFNSIQHGTERHTGKLLVKIETVFGCRNSNNLLIHQDLFLKSAFSYDNLNHFIVRAQYTPYNQMHPL